MSEHSAPRTLRSLESLRDVFDSSTTNLRGFEAIMGAIGTLIGAVGVLIRHTIRLKNRVDELERKLGRMEKFG